MNRTSVRFQRGAPLADFGFSLKLSILYCGGQGKRFPEIYFLIFPCLRKYAQKKPPFGGFCSVSKKSFRPAACPVF